MNLRHWRLSAYDSPAGVYIQHLHIIFARKFWLIFFFVSAIYNWRGDTRYGLPLEIGETVQILEECVGWYRGFTTKNRAIKGIFPQSYVFLKPCKVDNEGLFESVVPLEEPVIREVTLVLREWGMIWKQLFVVSRQLFYTVKTDGEIVVRNYKLLLSSKNFLEF